MWEGSEVRCKICQENVRIAVMAEHLVSNKHFVRLMQATGADRTCVIFLVINFWVPQLEGLFCISIAFLRLTNLGFDYLGICWVVPPPRGWVLQWSGPAGPRRYGPCGGGPREPAWARRAREPAEPAEPGTE